MSFDQMENISVIIWQLFKLKTKPQIEPYPQHLLSYFCYFLSSLSHSGAQFDAIRRQPSSPTEKKMEIEREAIFCHVLGH